MEPPGLTALLDRYLGLKDDERVALLYGSSRREVLRILENGLQRRGVQFKSASFERQSGSWDENSIKLLENPDYPVIILTSVTSIWHHPARKRAKYDLGKRIVSVICEGDGFDSDYSTADPEKMDMLGKTISSLLVPGAKVHLTSPNGTDVEATVENPFLESGRYDLPATGGNWPSGEVGFGPREGSVNGVIVYDLKFKHLGSLEDKRAKVTVRNDRCVKFDGAGGSLLKGLFNSRDKSLFWVGEVAIGLNPGFINAQKNGIVIDPDPRTIVEEKALSTAHFGHGGNLSFGKRKGSHADGVMAAPTVTVDGLILMVDGKFSRETLPAEVCAWLDKIGLPAK